MNNTSFFSRLTALLLVFALALSLTAGTDAAELALPQAEHSAQQVTDHADSAEDTSSPDTAFTNSSLDEQTDEQMDFPLEPDQEPDQEADQEISLDAESVSETAETETQSETQAETETEAQPEIQPDTQTASTDLQPKEPQATSPETENNASNDQPTHIVPAETPISSNEFTGVYFSSKDQFLSFGSSFTPTFVQTLPPNASFTSSDSSIVSVDQTTGKLTAGQTAGRADIQVIVPNAPADSADSSTAAMIPVDTLTVYTYHPTSFTVTTTGQVESPRILHTQNTINSYASRDYLLFKQQFDLTNYPWLYSHGCAVSAVADIAQGYGATALTTKWLSDEGVALIARADGLSASTIANGLKNKTVGFYGLQKILEYAGISSKIVSNWSDTRTAVEEITKNLSDGRPVVMCIYKNEWTNPRTGKTISLASSYHYMMMTGIDKDGYILNTCGSSANVQTNNALNGYEVKITVSELLDNFLNNKRRQNENDFFYDASSPNRSGTNVFLAVTCDKPKKAMFGKTVKLSKTSYTYNGKACKPTVTIDGLTENTDFTVAYSNNTNAGTATVTVTGKGDYVGTLKKTFSIKAIAIDDKQLALSAETYTYNGTACQPTVTIDGLTENTDFTVAYSDNINAGTAAVTVTGKGNYAGTLKTSFTITPASIEGKQITLEKTQYNYIGEAHKPTVTIDGLTENTDFTVAYSDNINAGTATVTVTGMGNYTGTATAQFTIVLTDIIPLKDKTLVLSQTEYTYTGEAHKPTVIVDGLQENTHFTVAYANNIDAGTATVTVTGMGNYAGTLTASFTIAPAPLGDREVVLSPSEYTYTGKKCEPAVTVDGLQESTHFTVAYANNINAGTATVTVTGMGNYTGTLTKSFKIHKATPVITAPNLTVVSSPKAQTVKLSVSCTAKLNLSYSSSSTKVKVSSKGQVTISKDFSGIVTISLSTPKNDNYHRVTKKMTLTVNPSVVTLSKLINSATGFLTAQWKQNNSATGYQVQCSPSSTFPTVGTKTATATRTSAYKATFSRLTKGKKYYVRVRAYKTVSGKKIYSAWSAKKSINLSK